MSFSLRESFLQKVKKENINLDLISMESESLLVVVPAQQKAISSHLINAALLHYVQPQLKLQFRCP